MSGKEKLRVWEFHFLSHEERGIKRGTEDGWMEDRQERAVSLAKE